MNANQFRLRAWAWFNRCHVLDWDPEWDNLFRSASAEPLLPPAGWAALAPERDSQEP